MSDIFLSYAKEDRDRAEALVEAFESVGWSVFWDRILPTGLTWREFIGKELEEALCIVVVWSAASVKSDWVVEEAEIGRKKGILIPVLFENISPPLGFTSYQAADLSNWDGNKLAPTFQRLTSDMGRLLNTQLKAIRDPSQTESQSEERHQPGNSVQQSTRVDPTRAHRTLGEASPQSIYGSGQHLERLSQSFLRVRRWYMFLAFFLFAYEVIGVRLESDLIVSSPLTNIRFYNPQVVPLLLIVLLIYMGYKTTLEWYECDPQSRARLPAKIDLAVSHVVGVTALCVYLLQHLLNIRFGEFDLLWPGLLLLTAIAPLIAWRVFRRWYLH